VTRLQEHTCNKLVADWNIVASSATFLYILKKKDPEHIVTQNPVGEGGGLVLFRNCTKSNELIAF
jgi:hypothetical protein